MRNAIIAGTCLLILRPGVAQALSFPVEATRDPTEEAGGCGGSGKAALFAPLLLLGLRRRR